MAKLETKQWHEHPEVVTVINAEVGQVYVTENNRLPLLCIMYGQEKVFVPLADGVNVAVGYAYTLMSTVRLLKTSSAKLEVRR